MFLLLGAPMLLLEMTLGQYGGMAPTKMFRNICPVSKLIPVIKKSKALVFISCCKYDAILLQLSPNI